MPSTSFLLLASLAALAAAEPTPTITALTADNFNSTAEASSFLFVSFTAPWCGHCKSFLPELEKASLQLQEDDTTKSVLATVDAVAHPQLYDQFNIKGFPTIKIVKFGIDVGEYHGERKAQDVVDFVKEVAKESTTEWQALATVEEAKKTVADAGDMPLVVGFFESLDSPEAQAFSRAALYCHANWVQYLATDEEAVGAEFGLQKGSAALIKRFDDKRHDLDPALLSEPKATADYVIHHAYPLLIEFSRNNHQLLFEPRPGYKNHVVLFVDPDQPYWSPLESDPQQAAETDAVKAVAKQWRGKALFMWVDATRAGNQKLCEQMKAPYVPRGSTDTSGFGYELADPVVRLIMSDSAAGRMRRFAFDGGGEGQSSSLTAAGLAGWLTSSFNSADNDDRSNEMKDVEPTAREKEQAEKQEQAQVEQVVPEIHPAALGKLLGSTSRGALMLAFHAPWCGHCKKLLPEYAKAAQVLAGQKANVELRKMDATDENNGGTAMAHGADGFPTIKFFPPPTLTDVPADADEPVAEAAAMAAAIKYSGERSADALVTFTLQHMTPPLAVIADPAALKVVGTPALAHATRPRPLMIGFLPEGELSNGAEPSAAHRVLKAAAILLRAKGADAQVALPAVSESAVLAGAYKQRGLQVPGCIIIRPFGGEQAFQTLPEELFGAGSVWSGKEEEDKAAQAIADWMEIHARPAMIPFSQATKKLVDDSTVKVQLLVLVNETTLYAQQGEHEGLREAMVAVGNQFRGRVLVVYVDCDWEVDDAGGHTGKRKNAGVLGFFGAGQSDGEAGGKDVPAVRLVDMRQAAMKQYALEDNRGTLGLKGGEGDGSGGQAGWQAGLASFAQAFLDSDGKKLTRRTKSAAGAGGEEQDAEAEAGTDGVVALSADQLSSELGKSSSEARSVLLEVYAPWCGHCKKLQPEYDALGQLFKASADSVLVAKMDGTANEVDGLDVDGFPHIVLFKSPPPADAASADSQSLPQEARAKARLEAALAYDGSRDLAGLSAFVHEHVSGIEGGGLGDAYPGGRVEL